MEQKDNEAQVQSCEGRYHSPVSLKGPENLVKVRIEVAEGQHENDATQQSPQRVLPLYKYHK